MDSGSNALDGVAEVSMSAEKYALLEARIRQTASLVVQLRDENRQLAQENERLRERVATLEDEARRDGQSAAGTAPDLDELLAQLDTLHETEPPAAAVEAEALNEPEPAAEGAPAAEAETPSEPDPAAAGAPVAEAEAPPDEEPPDEEPQTPEDAFELGKTHERRGQFESAVEVYQQLLDADGNNLDVAQRLAFLLEKLNREDEAAPLWDRIWKMRAGRSRRQRWSR